MTTVSPRLLAASLRVDEPSASLEAIHDEVLQLFDEHALNLRRCVRSCDVPLEAVDDIVQEAFLALYRHLCAGGARDNLQGWLFRVVYRAASKQRRRHQRTLRWQVPWIVQADHVPDQHGDPEASLLHQERCRTVQQVMAAMPERDRQCFHLRAAGLRYRQIADTLGVSLGAVAKSLARGMAKLAVVVKEGTNGHSDSRD